MDKLAKIVPPVARLRRAYWIWQILMHLLVPVAILVLLFRSHREPMYRQHLSHRFGLGPVAPPGAIFVFAASLGETLVVGPLIDGLLKRGHYILLCHATPAGLAAGQRLFGDNPKVIQRYVPLDLCWAVRLMLRRARPEVGLVVEIELWPAMLIEAARLDIPMIQVNGNLVAKSVTRDQAYFGGLRLELFKLFTLILTRTWEFKNRYIEIGVDPRRVHIVGDLKFDQAHNALQIDAATRLRRFWCPDGPVLLIASSVAAEEPELLEMADRLLRKNSKARLVWAPRSPQRFDAVAKALQKLDYDVQRRTKALSKTLENASIKRSARILVADSIGEMDFNYTLADIVFVGGSLCDHGGHNIIEPLSHNRPVLMGPSTWGIPASADAAREAGAFESFPDADTLSDRVCTLMGDTEALAEMNRRAEGFIASHLGASERSISKILPYLQNCRGRDR